ncbi:MAG: hypothetical protein F7C82_02640 [Desulfurococcales archaeon]|nr:hypothetical protein [Desulfurococcales archaeon]MCE4622832.1 hypothetical protein [Desulfurococcales archaeon]MCE4629155.1 hypothetical protein [Desulfurococcales archaeon]
MAIKIPLDKICIKSGVLCPRCESLVNSGKYTDLDVRVMKAFVDIEKKYRNYDIKYVKSYQIDDILYVLVESGESLPSTLGADVRKALNSEEISRVIIVEHRKDKRQLIEDLIAPYKVLGMQEAYLPDGSQVFVIKVPQEAKRLLDSLKGKYILKLAEKLLNRQIYVEYIEGTTSTVLKPEWLGIKKPNVKDLLDKFD